MTVDIYGKLVPGAQPSFLGPQGKTAFDPGFDLSDGGLPRERPKLPAK